MDVLVKPLEQLPTRIVHTGTDAFVHFLLEKLSERRFNLLRGSAFLVDGKDPLLEIDPRLDTSEHIVRGTEHAVEQVELLAQKFEHPAVRFVAFVEKVDHDDIVLLSVAMTAADALFYPLGVPAGHS